MLKKIQRYWHIFWLFRRMKLMVFFEFRGEFLFWTGVSVMWTIFNYFFFDLLVGVTGTIGSWTRPQMFVLLSVFTLIDAFTWSWFYSCMKRYTQSVFSGDISQLFLKPIDTQFLIMSQENTYTNTFRFFIGAGMLIWSIGQLETRPTLLQFFNGGVLTIFGLALVYLLWFTMSTLSFWVERLDNIDEIIPAMRRLWQLPREVYVGVASTLFTLVIPVGLISSVPSEALLGKSSLPMNLYLIAFTIGLAIFSRWFFKFSVKKYSSVAN